MKKYEVIPEKWDEKEKEFQGDLYGTTYWFTTYKEAKAKAKVLPAARIDFYHVPRIDFDDDEMYNEACELSMLDYNIWTECYISGQQVPAVYIDGKPIMRWINQI